MVAPGDPMEDVLQFDAWKAALRKSCELQDKLAGFNSLDENILWVFFNRGCMPTPEAIIEDSLTQ
jgi:hypothetical protein